VLHGPSGTGKTTLALSVAQQTGLSTVVVNAATIRSKVIGSSESALARLVAQARAARPSLLLIDQLEALAPGGVRGTAACALSGSLFV
jgi:transitional endoplasmic reticulum ATPase